MLWISGSRKKPGACAATLPPGLVLLLAFPASAESIPSDPDPVPLAAGELAPFDGDLWPVVRSLRMVLRAEGCKERARLDIERTARQFQVEIMFLKKTHEAEKEADAMRLEILRAAIDDANPWYLSPPVIATIAATITVLAIVVAAYVTGPLVRQP